MKTFRGRITRGAGNHYLIDDSDSELSDSEVEPVFTAGNFDILIDGDFLVDDGEDDTTATSGSEEDLDDILDFNPVEVEEGFEEVSSEGYFAFGGRLRSRRRRSSQDSFESPILPLPNTLSSPQPMHSSATVDERIRALEHAVDLIYENRMRAFSESPASPDFPIVVPNLMGEMETDTLNLPDNANATETNRGQGTNMEGNLSSPHPPQNVVNSDRQNDLETEERNNMNVTRYGESIPVNPQQEETASPAGHNEGQVISKSGENGRTAEAEDISDKEEETCNPMVSDVEELDDDALRGDRIGSTTYSERHVLKLLMKWVQELPIYSGDGTKDNDDEHKESVSSSGIAPIDKTRFLENDFEEEMALLWDMSFEPDVMSFLVEHNAFNIIRETLDVSSCARLTEIGLGIMANILSQQSIVEDFSIHDASLKLVETVISQAIKMPRVPVLIQAFAVLRRITWFLRSVAYVKKWMDLLLSQEFLNCSNFIMSSSTNALLLGNVIVTLFTVLEALSPETEDREQKDDEDDDPCVEEESHNFFGKALQERKKDFENYRPFCETGFVPAILEGLNELMKNPKPRKTRKLTSTREKNPNGGDTTAERTLDEMEIPIPDGLVQNAILNGLSILYYLYKTPNGKEIIREHGSAVLSFLLDFFRKFAVCTDAIGSSSGFDYFALAMSLLAFCHKVLTEINQEAINIPVTLACKLMEEEEEELEMQMGVKVKQKDGQEHDSRTFIALVIHEYLASLADTFGQEQLISFKKSAQPKHVKFYEQVEKLVTEVSEHSSEVILEEHNNATIHGD